MTTTKTPLPWSPAGSHAADRPPLTSRVLLVDDVAEIRQVVRIALGGCPRIEVVAEAATGREAVCMAAEHNPDIVVLDLGLPDLTGTEAVERIRDVCDAHIVVLTGTERGLGGRFDAPVEGFVRKDEDLQYLVDMLDNLGGSGSRTAALALVMRPSAASVARAFVAEQCRRWSCDAAIEAAELIVSELVTNAVLHAGSHPQLLVAHRGRSLHLEISDDSRTSPNARTPSADDEHGRGLLIVAAYSAAWGVQATISGKRVWADIPCEQEPADSQH